jgi:urease accessory protein
MNDDRSTSTSGPVTTSLQLLRLLQLASPALPVGGFAYSQGLESAIHSGIVHNADSAQRWIGTLLNHGLARMEAPLWLRLHAAAMRSDDAEIDRWNDETLAARETAELRAESLQMGSSMLRIYSALGLVAPTLSAPTYTAAFAVACARLGIAARDGVAAYLWAWLENQVLVAVKTVPLGQQAGQAMLIALHPHIGNAIETAAALGDDDMGTATVGLALLSARHETQYSRLFRS